MIDRNDPVYRAILAPFEENIAATSYAMEQVRDTARERQEAMEQELAERAAQYEAESKARAEEAATKEPDGKADDSGKKEGEKPENPWAQPRSRQVRSYGYFGDEDAPRSLANDASLQPESEPRPTQAPPAPATRSRGRHARPDDDDDFDSGSWLRG